MSYLDNKEVRIDDKQKRHEVYEDGVDKDIASAEPIFGQVVSATRSHVSFRNISVSDP